MIHLLTDFGHAGPYVGEVEAALRRRAPATPVVRLMSDLPAFRPRPAAYLLAALVERLPADDIVLGVVDPGVGSAERAPIVVRADGKYFVGPGNGLFGVVAKRASRLDVWEIEWRPHHLSASFHGRDLFAPVAASLALGEAVVGAQRGLGDVGPLDWPDDLAEIVYVDGYGNAMTGIRAASLRPDTEIVVDDQHLRRARCFSEVAPGEAFWYENSSRLVELAVNQGNAARELGLKIGDTVVRKVPELP